MSMTPEELAAAQAREYGTYVAIHPIDIRGARAFNVGDPVPVGHVESGLVPEDSIAKATTKAGRAATGSED
jgi:hypothetical protein